MKQTIILLALLAVGCTADVSTGTRTVEGCRYIVATSGKGMGIVHAGNCPNPIHYSDTCCKHK